MSLDLPQDGETGWGEKFRQACNTLYSMISGKADQSHTHSGYALASDLAAKADKIDLAAKADIQHKHLLSDITDMQTILANIENMTVNQNIAGTSATSPNINLWCYINGNCPLLIWEIEISWGGVNQGKITSLSNLIVIPKPEANSSLWINNKTSINITIKAKNPINNTVTAPLTVTYNDIEKYNYLSLGEVITALGANDSIIQNIAAHVAQKVTAEVIWAVGQNK